MTEVCPSIQIIFEQQELITKCKAAIEEQKENLKKKPSEVIDMIKVFNSKNKEELESESLMVGTLAEVKKNIWEDISKSMTEVWISIWIIFEHKELITK